MRVKVRRSGSVFIGVTVFLGVAAANTGNNLLYILVSALLSIMLVSGMVSLINLRGIRLTLIPPPRVFAGSPATFRVILRKRGPFPSFLIRVSSGTDSCLFTIVDSRPREGRIEITFARRGRVGSVTLTVMSDFPLGMFVRSYEAEVGLNLVVFPRPLPSPLRFEETKESADREGRSVSAYTKGYDEVRDIREYSGEPMKLIHWKVTAKVGDLMIKETVSETKRPVILSLESVEGDLETRISRITYLAMKLIAEGYPVGLRIGDREIPPGSGEDHLVRILSELATY